MSPNTITRAATVVAGLLASTASAAFNAAAATNVAMYWGQGNAQIDLTDLCNDASVDIVNIAFVNQFPQKVGDYPGTNFANACGDTTYTQPDGTKSNLLSNCPGIGPGIKQCQANGKKVLLSIGGGWPTDYTLPSQAIAEYFADFLWGAFGPSTTAWVNAGKPRPFGDASVDGFDLDIESLIDPAPFTDYKFANYDKLVARLKNTLFPTGPGTYYISSAPQCVLPDAHLADAISKSHFDFIFTQFYNTPECSTRAGYNGLTTTTTTFTFTAWADWLKANSFNKNVKLYLGMPAGVDGAPRDPTATLTITEANALLTAYAKKHPDIFGGAMLWEATVSARNAKCSKGYSSWIKDILTGKFKTEVCPSSTSSIASSTSSAPVSTPTIPTPDGTCGGTTGYTCIGFALGECCSPYGYCGSSVDHCGVGCDPRSGKCGTQSSSSSIVSTTKSSTAVSSTTRSSTVVSTTKPASTTSSSRPVTTSTTLRTSTRTSSSAASTPTKKVSTDATCGGTNGYTCQGSTFGNCCSTAGWCGATSDYCGTGCQSAFGTCGVSSSRATTLATSTRTSSAAQPSATKKVSTDATCGGTNGYTCQGSTFGNCCSTAGWCGATSNYCGTGCQKAFGTCT